MFDVSLIITTALGREDNLHFCLQAISQQTLTSLEIIVVNDGSRQAASVCEHHKKMLPHLRCLDRPQDLCVARSRNLGAQVSQGKVLVLIDGDIILNPMAIAAYFQFLQQYPAHVFYGYFGNDRTLETPSFWFPERRVNPFDRRFRHFDSATNILFSDEKMRHLPQKFSWSGNIGLCRSTYEALHGFDEGYLGWGEEDVDFAEQVIESQRQIHFLLDAWGEHQVHSRQEAFHKQAASGKQHNHLYTPITYTLETMASKSGFQGFIQAMANHYSQYLNEIDST